ncbi:MAG TPA: cyanophycin synthetase, partial [Thermomonas sp.]|nr:cyanophycin synthetase [Thermomonas sp.]
AAMPLSVGGAARYNIANIAAASLAAHALGIAASTIAGVLARFGARNADNPGRLQRWTLGDVDVLLDYAHNPDGLRGLLDVAAGLRRGGRLGLLLGHAGNRLESDFHALAAVAADAKPERVWLKDIGGDYLRGRASGDVAMILRDALLASGMAETDLPVCLDEAQASREALAWARAGDLLVLPVHELARRDEVVALLDHLQAEGWRAGEVLPVA